MPLIIDDPGLVRHLFPDLGRYHAWALVIRSFPAVSVPLLEPLAEAVSALWIQGHAVEVAVEPQLVFERVRHHVGAAVNEDLPVHPAGAVPVAGPVVLQGFLPMELPVFPAGQAPVFGRPADSGVGVLPYPLADNDNSGRAAISAVQLPDICRRNTGADIPAVAHAPGQRCDSIYSIRCDDVPSHCPSAVPSVAAHLTASR